MGMDRRARSRAGGSTVLGGDGWQVIGGLMRSWSQFNAARAQPVTARKFLNRNDVRGRARPCVMSNGRNGAAFVLNCDIE